MFDPVDPKQSLPKLEEGIQKYWQEENTFRRSIWHRHKGSGNIFCSDNNTEHSRFSFYDGPPFATGLPHYGHLLAGTIKDVIPRYQTMKGLSIERRFGWDCHGLPIENLIEQENGIKDHKQITDEIGVEKFNEMCRSAVQRYTTEWRKTVERMGRFVDMDWDYRTMDPEYMESMWWAFKEIYKKGLIYEGHKPMHICPRCVTPLSNFEVTQGYADVTDQSVTVKFELLDKPGTYILAWTTTPWTLAGNVLLAVGPDIEYTQLKMDGNSYILATATIKTVFKDQEYEIEKTLKGKEMVNWGYEPLFPYFKDYEPGKAFRVAIGDFVATDEGTGVVHVAMGFGEDDYNIGRREGLSMLQHVDMNGCFTKEVTDFSGQEVKPKDDPGKTDRKIVQWLKEHGKVFSSEKYTHSYPHCWRCDSPLLNYATSSWFVKVEAIKEKMLKEKDKTSWVPAHIKDGRYGKWLEGARDWALSRNRFWGTPLPIWRQDGSDEIEVIGSRDELMEKKLIRFTKVTVMRHAESEGNVIPIYQGKPPGTDLTKNGKEQARKAARWIAGQSRPVDVVYCSPLARTKQTAEAVAKATGAEVVVDERLRELSFGEYEGKTVDFSDPGLLKARRAHKLENNQVESIYHFAGMETWQSVQNRIKDFFSDILPRHRSQHIVVVTHADPVMNIRHFFTGEDPMKISHQPYPRLARPEVYFWDHITQAQMDLHKHRVDDITFSGKESDETIEVTLVRHGETDDNAKSMLSGGDQNPDLNETGKKQVQALADSLKGKDYNLIISSDLQRAVQSAQILSKTLNVPHNEQWPELRERDMTSWQGMSFDKFFNEHKPACAGVNPVFHHDTPEKGESLNQFLKRLNSVKEKIMTSYPGKKILVVAHRGAIQAFVTVAENYTYKQAINSKLDNAATLTIKLNPLMKRIPEVVDCWFESGSMPYAQEHWPFEFEHENIKGLPPNFPADFIAEGVDQTRAWFYTLMVLSVALFGNTPFEHVVVNGIVLAEDGKKMSKRLKNYPEPMEVVNKYGADAIRFTLMESPAVRAEDLRFSEKAVEETMRNVLLPLWNTYSFFVTYANAANFKPQDEAKSTSSHPLDLWITAETQDLVNRMTKQMNVYDLSATCSELDETIDALTNWYIRLSRKRFAGKTNNDDKLAALQTLHYVLLNIAKLLAPFCPFITEAIYLNLVEDEHGSIHLTGWPAARPLSKKENALLNKNRLLRKIVSLGHKVRAEAKIKVRQPLNKAKVALPPDLVASKHLSKEDHELLRQELNVKDIEFLDNPSSLADTIVQVDARRAGPRLGARVQEIIRAGKAGKFSRLKDGSIKILNEVLSPDEAKIVYQGKEGQNVQADCGIAVTIDTKITPKLEQEGLARDIIRTVQRLRKDAGLQFTDKIDLQISNAEKIISAFGTLISREANASFRENSGQRMEVDIQGIKMIICFKKS